MNAQLSYEEWLAWRQAGIGGSDAPVVMKASPWMAPDELLLIKTGQKDPEPANFVMRRGLRMEPEARAAYEELTGITMPKALMVREKQPFIRGSFDGLNKDEKRGLEIKCPGREDHLTALRGKVPDKYVWQCVHLQLLCGFKKFDYFSYNPDFGPKYSGIVIPFERSKQLEAKLLEEETMFWKQVQKILQSKETPMPQQTNFYTAEEIIRILHEAKKAGVTSLVLPGYEAAFDVTMTGGGSQGGNQGVREQVEEQRHRRAAKREKEKDFVFRTRSNNYRPQRSHRQHRCQNCRSTRLEDWMSLCFDCYREVKQGG